MDQPAPARGGAGGLVAALSLSLFTVVAVAVAAGWTRSFDERLLVAVGAARPAWATAVMRGASVVGSGAVEIPLGLLLSLALARNRRRQDAIGYAGAVLSGWAVSALVKIAVGRVRPRLIPRLMRGAGWYAFPSGHASLAPLVFGLGALIWAAPWPKARRMTLLAGAGALSVLIAWSRVYLGVHWPTDAIGGLLLGTGWSALWVYWRDRPRRPVSGRGPTSDAGDRLLAPTS